MKLKWLYLTLNFHSNYMHVYVYISMYGGKSSESLITREEKEYGHIYRIVINSQTRACVRACVHVCVHARARIHINIHICTRTQNTCRNSRCKETKYFQGLLVAFVRYCIVQDMKLRLHQFYSESYTIWLNYKNAYQKLTIKRIF